MFLSPCNHPQVSLCCIQALLLIKEQMKFKEETSQQLSEIKGKELKENTHLNDGEENMNIRQIGVQKTIQDLRMEFDKETDKLKGIKMDMKMKIQTQ